MGAELEVVPLSTPEEIPADVSAEVVSSVMLGLEEVVWLVVLESEEEVDAAYVLVELEGCEIILELVSMTLV